MRIMKKGKRGNILVENVVFIILNVAFLAILILFLLKQSSGAIVLEQVYAKQIALLADSAKPITTIKLNMKDAFKMAEKNKFNFNKIVKINGNLVRVKLSEKSGYSYSFFNNADVNAYPDVEKGFYIIQINEKIENELSK